MWETIAQIPWWNYALFAYLLWIGSIATKPKLMMVKNLYFALVIVFVMALLFWHFVLSFTLKLMLYWLGTLLIGTLLGWMHFYLRKIKAIQNTQALYFPGSWDTLIIVPILFIIQLYYRQEHPFNILQPPIALIVLLLYGLCTGLILGRIIYSVRCLKKGPYFVSAAKNADTVDHVK